MDWLHFIGRQYYTIREFIKESHKLNCSRRIDLRIAQDMSWGDKVYLAHWNQSHSILFGFFYVTSLSGLSEEAIKAISERFKVKKIDDGGRLINRGCGTYIEGASYTVETTLRELAIFLLSLKNANVDIGKPLISGSFEEIQWIKLLNIPFRQGYRRFNYAELEKNIDKRFKMWRVKGQFYIDEFSSSENVDGKIQSVINYSQGKIK